jgi:Flagellar assembly protein T, C-terminal domain
MTKPTRYSILNIGLTLILGLVFSVGIARAQVVRNAPTAHDIYCSGIVTDQRVPNDTYVISGENSWYKIVFRPGEYVFINRGASKGVKVGDEFDVIRPVQDMEATMWFKYQVMLSKAMGTMYADIGRLRVVHVDDKTSTAQSVLGCDSIQRGDIVRPFAERPAPQFHDATKFDIFAPPSGKKMAMVVNTKEFGVIAGAGKIVYVNLGSAQGVQVGDYFRVFRYQGTHNDTIYQVRESAYMVYGFGSTPSPYQWNDLPRQIIGEGIVLRSAPNASTVLLTTARQEIYAGDYVEVE